MKWTSVALKTVLSFAAVTVLALSTCAPKVYAASISAPFTTGAKVSFTFDDGFTSALTQAAPVLDKYGFPGTEYVVTSCVGMATVPNTCPASPNASYLTWDEITQLSTTYGWEIASHTVTHPLLTTGLPAGGISAEQVAAELEGSRSELEAHGFTVTDFAAPYGSYDNETLSQIAKYYTSQRSSDDVDDIGLNTFPYNDYQLKVVQVQADVDIETIKHYIDRAKAEGKWLILAFYDIKADDDPTYNPEENVYQYKVSGLNQIAAYVKDQGIPVTDVAHGLANGKNNMFVNGDFNKGIAEGWVVTDPERIVSDNAGNGSYDGTATGAVNSVAMIDLANDQGLISPVVSVDAMQKYVIKSYINVLPQGGKIEFFIDEYDSAGEWVSGQYYNGVRASADLTVRNFSFIYQPTSEEVVKMRLQIVAHGRTTTAYIDNVRMFSLSDLQSSEVPEETETSTPTETTPGNGGGIDSSVSSPTAILAANTVASQVDNSSIGQDGQVKAATTTSGNTPNVTANTTQNKAGTIDNSKLRKTWLWALILLVVGTTAVIIRSRNIPAKEIVSHEEPNKKSKS